jgi:CheY-like chemotaxis protein
MTTGASSRGRVRVLIIEDNRATAESLRRLIELFGYDVKVAYTGPEGVQAARDWTPDFVLCDIGLPGMDGYEVATTLRQDLATANARLVAITAYGSDDARKRSQEVGFEHHFVKPVHPAVLISFLSGPPGGGYDEPR